MVDVWTREFEQNVDDFNLTYPKGFGPSKGYHLIINDFEPYGGLTSRGNRYSLSITNENNYFDVVHSSFTLDPGYFYKFKILPSHITTTSKFDSMRQEDRKCGLYEDSSKMKHFLGYTKSGCELECGWVILNFHLNFAY
jgi:hypothetical protein